MKTKTQTKRFGDVLEDMHACCDARQWVADKTARQAWKQCHSGVWMLWLAEKLAIDRKLITGIACEYARKTLEAMPIPLEDPRPLQAIKATEAWLRGKESIAKVRRAGKAAMAARHIAAASIAGFLAYSAYAPQCDTWASLAISYALDGDGWDSFSRKAWNKEACARIRELIPFSVIEVAIERYLKEHP